MMSKSSIALFALLLLSACSKKPVEPPTAKEEPREANRTQTATVVESAVSKEAGQPAKPKQLAVIRDKDEVERLAQAAHEAEQKRPRSTDVTVRPTPMGTEAVMFKGEQIFEAKHVVESEAHPSGTVLILAQLVGNAAVTRNPEIEYTEGQDFDPVGVWLYASGKLQRISKPNSSVINAKLSPSGRWLALSEYIQNEHHQNVLLRCSAVEVSTGKVLPLGGTLPSTHPVSIGEWLSDTTVRVFATGETSLEQAITYEIASN